MHPQEDWAGAGGDHIRSGDKSLAALIELDPPLLLGGVLQGITHSRVLHISPKRHQKKKILNEPLRCHTEGAVRLSANSKTKKWPTVT